MIKEYNIKPVKGGFGAQEIKLPSGSEMIFFPDNQDFPGEHRKQNRGEIFYIESHQKGDGTNLLKLGLSLIGKAGSTTVNLSPQTKAGKGFILDMIEKGILGDPIKSSETGKLEFNLPGLEKKSSVRESQLRLIQAVSIYNDQWENDHPAGQPADTFFWEEIKEYPVQKFNEMSLTEWLLWFKAELEIWAQEGQPDRFDDMLNEDISTPVIGVDLGDKGIYIWDGYHRIAASITAGRSFIPAIIGRPLSDAFKVKDTDTQEPDHNVAEDPEEYEYSPGM